MAANERLKTSQAAGQTPAGGWTAWRWPIVLLASVAILVAAGVWLTASLLGRADRAADAVGAGLQTAARTAVDIARGFSSEELTETFIASLPTVEDAGVGRLEIATAQATETFARTDEKRILWDQLSLGRTVAEIRVPVTYRYHVRLDDPWRLEVEDGVVTVFAPRVRPSQPPAIHTDGMEKRVDSSWLRWDEAEQMEALERSITPTLTSMAGHPRKLDLVRDRGRETVARFVRGFLVREGAWRDDGVRAVRVVFEGEKPEEAAERLDIVLEDR